jgi:UDP:flavonoid glycosyltransferase YjiC (YdhE family)
MKFVLACYGTRGDVEPSVVVGRELKRRGHTVVLAVPPDLRAFAEAAGLDTVAYGLDTKTWLDVYRNFWTYVFHTFWRVRAIRRLWRDMWRSSDECWAEMNSTLMSVAEDADVIFTGQSYQEPAANVAEFYDIPLVTLHHIPMRPNGQLVSILPPWLSRRSMSVFDWIAWRLNKRVEDAQRRELGLPKATVPSPQRIADRGALEVQGYDEVCFPGLAAEWSKWGGSRPFVGTLTMELTGDSDTGAMSWIHDGTPPICFGFGSMPVESPADALSMISSACEELGERALVCAGWSDFSGVPIGDHVKVVQSVNYGEVFAACRAVVHHGGSGTTAASMRAGVPTLILSMDANQTLWGGQVKRLKIGSTRRFSTTTRDSLVDDLRHILTPQCAARARELAHGMSKPVDSYTAAADVVEEYARARASA